MQLTIRQKSLSYGFFRLKKVKPPPIRQLNEGFMIDLTEDPSDSGGTISSGVIGYITLCIFIWL